MADNLDHHFTISLTADQYALLNEMADYLGLRKSSMARLALQAYATKEGFSWPGRGE